jgi:hypothetical protein
MHIAHRQEVSSQVNAEKEQFFCFFRRKMADGLIDAS